MTLGVLARVGGAVARHPGLWRTAMRQWRRTTAPGWWRHRPFLPAPSREYVQFRLLTHYGRADARVAPGDVLNYLLWCKRHDQMG